MSRENVLLLCLSKVSAGKGITHYIYEDDTIGEPIEVDGYMTNEAPAKVALSLVDLDRIVVLCSKEVLTSRPPREGEDEVPSRQTHFGYYQQEISKFAADKGKPIPEFKSLKIENDPEEYEIAQKAVEASEQIMGEMGEGKDVHVYIDYNGGLRYVASMLLNIANLMEQRGAVVENIFTMNFENKNNEGRVIVGNFKAILQSSRLVSGIKEYVDYGRCGELKKYFNGCGDQEIEYIINQMDALSHNFNLCDVSRIFAKQGEDEDSPPEGSVETVKGLLEDYIQKDIKSENVFAVLFRYVAEDILEGYRPLFQQGDLLNMIDWCLEKDYIQQAVTFYAERMPVYFWDNHVYYPSEDEEAEYEQILKACESYKKFKKNKSYKDASSKKKNKVMRQLLQQDPQGPCQAMSEDYQVSYLQQNFANYDWKASWMMKYLEYSDKKNLDWMVGEKRKCSIKYSGKNPNPFDYGRARTDFSNMGMLKQILKDYGNIKAQRNYINHVDDKDADYNNRWPYNTLVDNLRKYVDKIRNYMADGAK